MSSWLFSRGVDGGTALHLGVIVARRERAALEFVVGLRARPTDAGHPVVTDDRDAEVTAVPEELL